MIAHPLSGRQDSNLRPPGPKPGAMTGLRYAPNIKPMLSMTPSTTARTLRLLIPLNLHFVAVGAGLPPVVSASLRHEPCGFSSLSTFTSLRWERDYLRWSPLRYGTNPAASHPSQPSLRCGGSGIRTRGTVTRTTV